MGQALDLDLRGVSGANLYSLEKGIPMQPLTLYHVPPSFYSQIARLALTEAGLSYTEKIIVPGPPNFVTYAPGYMRLNPGGWVPTLIVGNDKIIDDSRKIIDWIAGLEGIPSVVPHTVEERSVMDQWIARSYALSEREMAYGSGITKVIGRFVNMKRLKALRKFRTENPDMAAIYDAKIADIEDFVAKASDRVHIKALAARFSREFGTLDQHLAERHFIAGTSYSLADCVWTVGVARHQMLKKNPLPGRPNLARWFEDMKLRPSFAQAGIMTHLSFKVILKVLSNRITIKDLPHSPMQRQAYC